MQHQSIRVRGPGRIKGSIRLGGNKNAALPILAASLLSREEIVLHNVPEILDVSAMLNLLRHLGVKAKREGSSVHLHAEEIRTAELPKEICSALRTSFLFAGPLCARVGEADLWPPGGDMIGRRRLDAHIYGLKKLGIDFRRDEDTAAFRFRLRKRKLAGAELFLDEASVTATEHILMTSVLARGETVIRNAAAEPHVQQLAEFLNHLGAKISGIGTNTLTVEGVSRLHGGEFTIDGDHVEAASFLALAACTRGELELTGQIQPRHYWMTRRVMERFGIRFRLEPGRIVLLPVRRLKVVPDFGNAIPMISDGPWPQFPSDMMSSMIVTATQAEGSVLFFEKMFESRIYFVDRLISMGANAIVCDPHRVVITGPSRLRGVEMSSPDIRAGMAMVSAAVCAEGESVIRNADTISRGYENLPGKLRALGVDIAPCSI